MRILITRPSIARLPLIEFFPSNELTLFAQRLDDLYFSRQDIEDERYWNKPYASEECAPAVYFECNLLSPYDAEDQGSW